MELSHAHGILYICDHPFDTAGICIKCGQKLDSDDRVSLGYLRTNFRVSNGALFRLRAIYSNRFLRRKKLHLVLDLDHTLLNSSFISSISSREVEYLNEAFPDTFFRIDQFKMMTKLRPFVRAFLKEATDLFDLWIYTLGERKYALQMAKLLDPQGVYFESRIISRDDCTVMNRKSLDVVVAQENRVIILDDTRRVWEEHHGQQNLIEIERYHYFPFSSKRHGLDQKSFCEMRCDESERHGPLSSVLQILKEVHSLFFDEACELNLKERDVREVLTTFNKKSKLLQENEFLFTF